MGPKNISCKLCLCFWVIISWMKTLISRTKNIIYNILEKRSTEVYIVFPELTAFTYLSYLD